MKGFISILSLFFLLCLGSVNTLASDDAPLMTAAIQEKLTPDQALSRLMQGNQRFVSHQYMVTDVLKKVRLSAKAQYPAAVVLSCIDSRISPEIVFDQSIGNIFVTRVAANVINADVLGGLEFATRLSGAKLIVVMGHDACGAIKGACQNVELGNLTQLLSKIQPAINEATTALGKKDCDDEKFINTAAADNVRLVMKMIPEQSPVIRELVKTGKIKIVGAMYHLSTGKVEFFDSLSDSNRD